MVFAFQFVLLVIIVVSFIGMIGSDDDDLGQLLLLVSVASIGAFLLTVLFG